MRRNKKKNSNENTVFKLTKLKLKKKNCQTNGISATK